MSLALLSGSTPPMIRGVGARNDQEPLLLAQNPFYFFSMMSTAWHDSARPSPMESTFSCVLALMFTYRWGLGGASTGVWGCKKSWSAM